jgi:hypothetical protein
MPTDPIAIARSAKQIAALQRDARSILRKLDKLANTAEGVDPPLPTLIAEAREALERLATHLSRQEHTLKAQVREALRRQ